MTMTKTQKNDTTAAELRAKAEALLEALRVATTTRDEAARALAAMGKPTSKQDHLRHCLAQQAVQVAEDECFRLQAEASSALDLAEIAEGCEDSVDCEPNRLHADVVAILAVEDEIRRQLDEQRRRRVERVERARKASDAVSARRQQQGLSLSPSMVCVRRGDVREILGTLAPFEPRPHALEVTRRDGIARTLEGLITPGPTKTKWTGIGELKRQEVELRASIERDHRDAEERAARLAEFDRRKAREQEEADARQRAETERLRAQAAAEQQRIADLAAAQREREFAAQSSESR
jgi:hypothetical protein